MKSLKILSLLMLISALAFGQDITVKGTTRLNTDLHKYKTYGWAKTDQTRLSDNGYIIYSYSEGIPNGNANRKNSKGNSAKNNNRNNANNNKNNQANNNRNSQPMEYIYGYDVIIPATDMTVNSTIQNAIAAELEGRGYRRSDSNPDLLVSYKVLEQAGQIKGYVNDNPEVVGGTEIRTPDDTTTYAVEPGTLLINLVDTKTSEVVWDGFASGLIENDLFMADPLKLKEAVHRVFNKFQASAKVTQAR